ncbi:uncharacterized protein LOC110938631 isoform X1 [Helianthus annuus]|uniref:uncharacterized protein LOC110938631 isoform X1 n=1 Tax=Helianthus annuus TaxID=4232 RepID=UPI000B8F4BF1|nr:uncharacterized protein LOC110938631 isoform X1 [Helianthus annuus]
MHGSPRFPIRYLIMNHLWICRNKYGRDIVPYCRIITGLMKQQKAITSEDRGATKRHQPFTLDKLGIGWSYTQSERYHKLKSEGQRWRALKLGARDLLPGEPDEPESDEEVVPSGDEDYADEPHGGENVGQGGYGRGYGGMFYDYTQQSYVPGWAYEGTMQEVIENQRPPASVFDTWSGAERTLYDQNTRWKRIIGIMTTKRGECTLIIMPGGRWLWIHNIWIMRLYHRMMVVFRIQPRRSTTHNGLTQGNKKEHNNNKEEVVVAAHLHLENGTT